MKLSNFNLSIENKKLLTDVNVEFSEGKINHILGKNGVGKSIFAKSLMLDNENITVIGSYSNVPEDITFNELRKVLIKKFDMNKVDHLCSILNISNIDEKIILKKLSDGQRQKIKILVFLLFDKDIIILDEVTNALDKTTSYEIYELFNDYIKKNPKKVILNITHNLSDLNNMDGEYYLFEDYDIKKYSNRKELIDLYINGGN
ncbi:MAG: ATP-binding cassette domain-containing protein [Lachnospiraceae bacterium]|nr:ATP-binding cassette domain-containing protein [Lachnospiraceae bacterium]